MIVPPVINSAYLARSWKNNKAGKVYLMLFSGGLFKIGYTSGSLDDRVSSMLSEYGERPKLVGHMEGTRLDEQVLHRAYEDKRVKRELFRLTRHDIIDLYVAGFALTASVSSLFQEAA
jgi:hypothetical protein